MGTRTEVHFPDLRRHPAFDLLLARDSAGAIFDLLKTFSAGLTLKGTHGGKVWS